MIHVIVKTGATALVALLGLGHLLTIDAANAQQSTPAQQRTLPAPSMKQAMQHDVSRRTVQKVQAALNNKGFKLDVDGYVGDSTKAALKKYQQDNQLPASGEIDTATLKKLGVS